MKIAVAGTGYVGLSIATLLSQNHEVMAVDIVQEKVEKINKKISPIQDEYIEKYLKEKPLNLTATLDAETAYKDSDFVVIAAPTNYDSKKNFFDCSAVEAVIELVLKVNPDATMIIKEDRIYWCDCGGLSEKDIESYTGTTICASKARWRAADEYLGAKEIYVTI